MKKAFYIIALCVAVCGVTLQLTLMYLKGQQEEGKELLFKSGVPALQTYATVPPFTLTDQDEKPFGMNDLKGKVWLASFIYTHCPDICPMLNHRFQGLQEKALALGATGDQVRLVSFSVDPDRDTPPVLAKYATALKATDKWHFLTGQRSIIEQVARDGFLVGFEQVPGTSLDFSHSTKIALVDRNGVVRGYYDGVGEVDETPRILADLEKLLQEKTP